MSTSKFYKTGGISIINALIVSTGDKSAMYLHNVLKEAGCENIIMKSSVNEARRFLINKDIDLCVINAPLIDETGEEFACGLVEQVGCQVILLVKAELCDEVSHKVEDIGVITVSKPINRALLWNSIKIALAAYRRMKKYQMENSKLLQKLEDIKVIDRAKCILISCLSLDEEEAHKYIEKQAMNKRISKREVAEQVLNNYQQ